jgi:peptide-methionine (R)-S-oxide reductase
MEKTTAKISKSENEWERELTPEQYYILRKKGTEPPFSGQYLHNHDDGVYVCAACGNELFDSNAKFESGTGWPSFSRPIAPDRIEEKTDRSLWMTRTEILCSRCDGHLGHVFDDGPEPTGLRFCLNSSALKFIARKNGDGTMSKE